MLRQKMTIDLAGPVEKADRLKALNDAEKALSGSLSENSTITRKSRRN